MRRILILALVTLLFVPAALMAQTDTDIDFADLESDIQAFADGVASSLPLNASVGLNWSDAYIGQFPHFGVGLTVGASTIPFEAASPVLDGLGLTDTIANDPNLAPLLDFGMPLPAYAVEARIGGLLIPFDVGIKVGIMPPDFSLGEAFPKITALQTLELDYMNLGFDVRMPIVEERGLIPEISVGGGYNYLRANIGFQGILGGDLNIGTFEHPDPANPAVYNVTMTDPTVNYEWQANVIDLKAQVSKGLLFFRPYAGVGASVGFGRAGSGFESTLEGISPEDIALINTAAEQLGSDVVIPELSGTSFYLSAPMTGGWSFRAFGGVSINLLIVKIDINAMYDFLAHNYGATVGLRVQL
jgi:hypothetical protein